MAKDYLKENLLDGVPLSDVIEEALQEVADGDVIPMTEEELREFVADPAAFERKRRILT